jgi:predicted Zn-dependent protease
MNPAGKAAERVIELVGERAEAEAFVQIGRTELTRFANSFIHQNVGEDYVNVRLRVASGARVAAVTGNHADSEALAALVDDALAVAATQRVDPDWPGVAPAVDLAATDFAAPSTVEATPGQRAEVVRDFVAAGSDYLAAGYCDTDWFNSGFANSAGQVASSRGSRATIDGIHQTEESAGSGHQTSAALENLDGVATGSLAAERARRGLGAFDLEPGEYQVVLAPEAVATTAIFLGFYGFNGKAHNEDRSFAELGAAQFDERITLADDPLGPAALASPFDVEGTPKLRCVLVDGGVTEMFAHDRRSAKKAGAETTGHGWSGSASNGPVPAHLVVTAGSDSVDEMIAAVDRGVYVAAFNYCRILDPKTQVVTGLTRNGTFMIENGVITGAVTNLRFTQSFLNAWGPGNVLGVGDDIRYADCDFGAGLVRAPSMRLASWNFTGGAGG